MSKLIAGAMVGLMAVSTPIGGNGGQWAQWGLAGVVVAYTLWRDMEREKRMSSSLHNHHEWVRNTLLDALQKNTAALNRISTVLDVENSE